MILLHGGQSLVRLLLIIIGSFFWFLLVVNIFTQWMCNAKSSYLQGPGSFPGSKLTFLNERRFVTVLG